jgi:hypothetical protein
VQAQAAREVKKKNFVAASGRIVVTKNANHVTCPSDACRVPATKAEIGMASSEEIEEVREHVKFGVGSFASGAAIR